MKNVNDVNGKPIKKGAKVIWYDPEEEARDLTRMWVVDKVSEDVIMISDEYGEAEVLPNEIEIKY